MADIEHVKGCLSVLLSKTGGMAVDLTPSGGITVTLAPVCAIDLGPVLPANALLTVDGRPFITADGYYLIVATS